MADAQDQQGREPKVVAIKCRAQERLIQKENKHHHRKCRAADPVGLMRFKQIFHCDRCVHCVRSTDWRSGFPAGANGFGYDGKYTSLIRDFHFFSVKPPRSRKHLCTLKGFLAPPALSEASPVLPFHDAWSRNHPSPSPSSPVL